MKMLWLGFKKTILFVLLVIPAALSLADHHESALIRDRLNRIFYWQIADELKLAPKAEKDLQIIIDDIQKLRNLALEERQKCLDELKNLEKNISSQNAEPILVRYQSALIKLAKLDTDEHERLKKLLGSESLAKFYLVRESVAEKVRAALRQKELDPSKHK